MKIWIAGWLRRIADWLDPQPVAGPAVGLTVADDDLLAFVRTAVQAVETGTAPGTSGEYKRHVVLSQALKQFPGRARDIAKAIEVSL